MVLVFPVDKIQDLHFHVKALLLRSHYYWKQVSMRIRSGSVFPEIIVSHIIGVITQHVQLDVLVPVA